MFQAVDDFGNKSSSLLDQCIIQVVRSVLRCMGQRNHLFKQVGRCQGEARHALEGKHAVIASIPKRAFCNFWEAIYQLINGFFVLDVVL